MLTNGRCLPEKVSLQETWGAMEELVDEGLTKNIGIRCHSFLSATRMAGPAG